MIDLLKLMAQHGQDLPLLVTSMPLNVYICRLLRSSDFHALG